MSIVTDETHQVDEQATLNSLETIIQKRRQAAELRDTVNQRYCQVSACEAEERKTVQLVDQLEFRVKTHHKQLLLGTTKPGDLPSLKQQLDEAKESLDRCRQELEERSASFCMSQEALNQLMSEIGELDRQLRNNLTELFTRRFHERDTGLFGKRGQVTWQDPDPNSPARWQAQWRERAFNFLLFRGLTSDIAESHLLEALLAFFRSDPFSVRVVIGFVPTTGQGREPLTVGELVTIPGRLSVSEAFEEIIRRRVVFVGEHAASVH